jgi:D-alanyl-D-alanine carboxypeptidase (penicillin-binding protein 5/6)
VKLLKKVAFILLVSMFFNIYVSAFYDQEDYKGLIREAEYIEQDDSLVSASAEKKEPKIQAPSAIVYDRKYKRIVYGKNINDKRSNASTTKIMTAIVAFENGVLKDTVEVSKRAARVGGSTIGLNINDKVTLNDLMYGLLICSGNDAAIAIAEHIGGDVESFCDMMNDKAKEIGALNTNFVSPHGLDDPEHFSTAYDLAIMADYALNIPYIANIVRTKKANIYINNRPLSLYTTNEMLSLYNGADGVKTGYTGDAGRCLVTSATRGDYQYISVVLGCNTKKQRTTESTKLLNYCFDNYKFYNLCDGMEKEFKVNIQKSQKEWYLAKVSEEYIQPLTEKERENIKFKYKIYTDCIAPMPVESQVGEIEVLLYDKILKVIPIKIQENINKKGAMNYILELLLKKTNQYELKLW